MYSRHDRERCGECGAYTYPEERTTYRGMSMCTRCKEICIEESLQEEGEQQ